MVEKGIDSIADLATKMSVHRQTVHKWIYETKGPPPAALFQLADLLDLSARYIAVAQGPRKPNRQTAQNDPQITKLLDDFNALPDGLKDHVARKAEKLRKYAESLPSFLRDSLKPPVNGDAYRSWEREMEGDMARLNGQRKK